MTNNTEAIQIIAEWFAKPDDLGEEFWEEYEQELKDNPFAI